MGVTDFFPVSPDMAGSGGPTMFTLSFVNNIWWKMMLDRWVVLEELHMCLFSFLVLACEFSFII
jgi:hypothetical protein